MESENDESDVEMPKVFEDPMWTDSEPEKTSATTEEVDINLEDNNLNTRQDLKGRNLREEPKGIVFISKLLQLFQFYHLCLAPSPSITMKQSGTMANEAGSSSAMEFLGHKRSFSYLLGTGMVIKSFISDRHTSICKWMREELPAKCRTLGKPLVNHFSDLWHIGKKINKSLKKLTKESDCELVGRWTRACIHHFYWSVTSTQESLGEVKLAKFHAFLSHILNQHTNLPNPLFNKCSHGPLQTNKVYFTKGSEAYEKLHGVLNKKNIVSAVKKASPVGQTSCLEGTVLAALHFNNNLRRETKLDDNGQQKLRVTYPKYKYGEATVRETRIPPNFEYVADIFECLTTTPRGELKVIREDSELKNSTPEPRYHMMECESKDDAIAKYQSRQQKEIVIVPSTCTDAELQRLTREKAKTRKSTYL